MLEQRTSVYSICSDIWFLVWIFIVLFTNTSFYIDQARLYNIKLKTCFLLIQFTHQCMKFIYDLHLVLNVLFDMKLNGIFRTIFNCILLYLYRLPGVSMMVNWSYHFLHNLVMVQQGEITLLTSDIRPYLYILSPTHTLWVSSSVILCSRINFYEWLLQITVLIKELQSKVWPMYHLYFPAVQTKW